MRASGVTNLALEMSVVSRTKAMIACFAAPSFQDGSGSAAACASAGRGTKGAGRMGSAAKVESRTRRLIPEEEGVDGIAGEDPCLAGRVAAVHMGRMLRPMA
jgi:hypothetical protein